MVTAKKGAGPRRTQNSLKHFPSQPPGRYLFSLRSSRAGSLFGGDIICTMCLLYIFCDDPKHLFTFFAISPKLGL